MRTVTPLIFFTLLACENKDAVVVDTTESLPATDSAAPVDADGDGVPAEEDCDDNDATVSPDAEEDCDAIDRNCDGDPTAGATDAQSWYTDGDADGFGSGEATLACEPPEGASLADGDCDDADARYFPGAEETDCADPNDYNCDGSVGFADNDGDGFPACEECDDGDAGVNPDAAEICDAVDQDCDGLVDEEVTKTYYQDLDGDGYGDLDFPIEACELPAGYSELSGDCDDGVAAVYPGALELCNTVDDDCDGVTDEDDAVDAATWYNDADSDGYGDPGAATVACEAPSGSVSNSTDCDDGLSAVNPGAAELCNDRDDDCDSVTDEDDAADAATWYSDNDGDGYGDPDKVSRACEAPEGAVSNAEDCDDGAAAVSPEATELCDGDDNDCDGVVDEDDAADAATWYADNDNDGYGDSAITTLACDPPSGYTDDLTDCDDGDSGVNPGAAEVCGGVDDDCDGVTDDLGPASIRAGSLTDSKRFQYSAVTAGAGVLYTNWDADPDAGSVQVAIGSTPGGDDVMAWTDEGSATSATLSGLTLSGAWTGAEYYLSARAANGSAVCEISAVSDAVGVAEGVTWTGSVSDLRANDAYGGYNSNWPQSGYNAVYGAHYFEEINIASGTTVYVQGFGKADAVAASVSSTASSVTNPKDGWVALYANNITVDGTITASGRGYGGGGAGCSFAYPSGCVSGGFGGALGLGGAGGSGAASYSGAGGGGSPGGAGGVGATTGGAGNIFGGGSGSTGCSGSNGRAGGDGTVSNIGGVGGTASSGSPGAAGAGEYVAGGGTGVSGCDNWSGGGGGGYGGGGGGGSQWASTSGEPSGGGGGGTGGVSVGKSANGGAGAGPYGGAGGAGATTGAVGTAGGYAASALNGDSSTDRTLRLGGGGGGGGAGYQEAGGGGGGAGGGAIHLYAYDTLTVGSTARLLANGAGGGGGARDNGGGATSGAGGAGAGGGLRLEAQTLTLNATTPAVSARGAGGSTTNGGTIKLFYDTFSGTVPSSSSAGRVYNAGTGSWDEP
jgi:hypothetical protein